MARPKKNTVEYFPHDCYSNKELEIFINKHGNEGYAFYYRLFELLGITPEHQYDFTKPVDYQYLLTKTGVNEDIFEQLTETLVDLEILDKELWKERKIWVQPFVDSIAEVYAKRTVGLPTKEGFRRENPSFRVGNSQSKGKETKLNKKRLNKRTGFLAECDKCDFEYSVNSQDTRMVCRTSQEHGLLVIRKL